MLTQTNRMKHRAAVAALLSLLTFLLCLIGMNLAARLAYNASHPQVDLAPLLARLQKGSDLWNQAAIGPTLWQVRHHGTEITTVQALNNNVVRLKHNDAARAWQAALQGALRSHPEILAAVVADPDGIIQSAYPTPERLVGQGLKPPPPGKRYPVPGITANRPTADGYYPFLRPNDPANGPSDSWVPPYAGGPYGPWAGAPYGPPGGPSGGPYLSGPSDPAAQDRAQSWRLRLLLQNLKIIDERLVETDAVVQPLANPAREFQSISISPDGTVLARSSSGANRLVVEGLVVDGLPAARQLGVRGDNMPGVKSSVPRLILLPRPNQPMYEFATSYLRPMSMLGALLSFVLYWCMLPWWTFLDARLRTDKAVPMAAFVALTNFLGWLTYLVIRPESDRLCPACVSLLEPGFRCCPHCGWSSATRCRQCGRAQRSDWRFCPYCETARTDSALAAADVH
jgi:hypothetical protein